MRLCVALRVRGRADVSEDGTADALDLLMLLAAWGECP
jgi:hypothetical protein